VDFRKSLEVALGTRRDYQQAMLGIEAKGVNLKMRKNQKLPTIDLIASFRSNGLDQKYAESFNEISNMENPTYFVGMQFSFPFGNKAAKSAYEQAQFEKAQALVALYQVERRIVKAVDDAVRAVLVAEGQVKHRKIVEGLYQDRLKKEKERFSRGRSTVQAAIDAQEDLIEAQRLVVLSIAEHHQAWIDLKRSENTLLIAYGYIPRELDTDRLDHLERELRSKE